MNIGSGYVSISYNTTKMLIALNYSQSHLGFTGKFYIVHAQYSIHGRIFSAWNMKDYDKELKGRY